MTNETRWNRDSQDWQDQLDLTREQLRELLDQGRWNRSTDPHHG